MSNKQLNISIDYSKIAVGIYSNKADGEGYVNADFLRQRLEKQINEPQAFIKEYHEDEFGHTYIRQSGGPGAYNRLKKKWGQVEFLITCVYNGRTSPCADGFELYILKKENNQVVDLVKIINLYGIDLEDDLIKKAFDDAFDAAMIDNELSFYLLEELTAQK